MKPNWRRVVTRTATLCACSVLACGTLAGAARAAGGEVSAQLGGDSVAVSSLLAAGSFVGQLTGAPQILDGIGFSGFSITDSRGTGIGWQVTLRATPFESASVVGEQLAPDSLTAPLFEVTRLDAGSSGVPGAVGTASIDNATGAVIAATSASGQGMGSYRFSADSAAWKLAVTADEYAGAYSSTVTTTVATLAL